MTGRHESAFPVWLGAAEDSSPGITFREYAAVRFMASLLNQGFRGVSKHAAIDAVAAADLLIEALNDRPEAAPAQNGPAVKRTLGVGRFDCCVQTRQLFFDFAEPDGVATVKTCLNLPPWPLDAARLGHVIGWMNAQWFFVTRKIVAAPFAISAPGGGLRVHSWRPSLTLDLRVERIGEEAFHRVIAFVNAEIAAAAEGGGA